VYGELPAIDKMAARQGEQLTKAVAFYVARQRENLDHRTASAFGDRDRYFRKPVATMARALNRQRER